MNRSPQARQCADALPHRRAALLFATAIAGSAIVASSASAQDLERERRLEAEIIDYILDGEPVHLDAGGRSFLAIHTEADDDGPRRAVIVLHGRGFHPDWAEVAAPLRVELPEHGWETLSLQMPVLEKVGPVLRLRPRLPRRVSPDSGRYRASPGPGGTDHRARRP